MRSAPSIAFDYRPSRFLALAMIVIAAAAIGATFFSALPMAVRFAVAGAVVAIVVFDRRRCLAPPIVRVAYSEAGWLVVDREREEHAASLANHARLGPLLSLTFAYGERKRVDVLLVPDNSDADLRRRLIVLLARPT